MTHQLTDPGNVDISHHIRLSHKKGIQYMLDQVAEMDFNKLIIQTIEAPSASGSATIHADITLTAGSPLVTSGIHQPDVPRVLSAVGVAGTEDGKITITGTNINDEAITDEITVSGSVVASGTKAFKRVESIRMCDWTSGSAGGEKIAIGQTEKLGLEYPLSADTIFLATVDGAFETTRPTVSVDADEVEKNFADPFTACNGSKDIVFAYLKI
jgi:hypothetical protein